MTVERTHNMSHQTRYELHSEPGLSCVLTYTVEPDEKLAMCKILLPGPGGTVVSGLALASAIANITMTLFLVPQREDAADRHAEQPGK